VLSSAVPANSGAAPLPAQEVTWDYPQTELGPMRVVVLIPEREPGVRLPVLVALHGRGEALKGPEAGARGWVDDYWLPKTIERLHRPPITLDDLQGFADEARLTRLNASLEQQPYQGLIVVCPYTPDTLPADESIDKALPLARFVVDTVLPRAYRETPALGTPETTGIDGVSLGGRAALGIGLLRPKSFAVVASLQAALRSDNSEDLLRRARAAKAEKSDLHLRLLTSSDDYFLKANTLIAEALSLQGIATELVNIPGPHDYVFNRGPGGYEMLMFHDRVLRGQAQF
jgi:iron(III)-salmochelin esterase